MECKRKDEDAGDDDEGGSSATGYDDAWDDVHGGVAQGGRDDEPTGDNHFERDGIDGDLHRLAARVAMQPAPADAGDDWKPRQKPYIHAVRPLPLVDAVHEIEELVLVKLLIAVPVVLGEDLSDKRSVWVEFELAQRAVQLGVADGVRAVAVIPHEYPSRGLHELWPLLYITQVELRFEASVDFVLHHFPERGVGRRVAIVYVRLA